jgi:hypothetical protein
MMKPSPQKEPIKSGEIFCPGKLNVRSLRARTREHGKSPDEENITHYTVCESWP